MRELLEIEYLKIKHYTIFKAFMLLFLVLTPILFYAASLLDVPFFPSGKLLFQFPNVWGFLTYLSSWLVFLPGILVISLVCNEVAYKTQKQNVIDGLSKRQVILSKLYVVLALSFVTTVSVFLLGAIFGLVTSGVSGLFSGLGDLFYFFIQTTSVLTFALLLSVIIRKASLSVITFIILFLFGGLIGSLALGEYLSRFLPLNAISEMVPNAWMVFVNKLQQASGQAKEFSIWINLVLTLVYSGLFVFLSYFIMKKRDL